MKSPMHLAFFFRMALLAILSVISSACGGGGGSNEPSSIPPSANPPQETLVRGGSSTSPAAIDLTKSHEITSNPLNNYFEISVESGDTIYIYSNLESEVENADKLPCIEGSSVGYVGINIVDVTKSCVEYLVHTFELSGTAVINLGYTSTHVGFFDVALIPGEGSNTVVPSEASLIVGRPDSPATMSTTGNAILDDWFLNYFEYDATEGEQISIQVNLNSPVDNVAWLTCVEQGARDFTIIGIKLDNVRASCETSLVYTFERSGIHIFNFGYDFGNSGSFDVTAQ